MYCTVSGSGFSSGEEDGADELGGVTGTLGGVEPEDEFEDESKLGIEDSGVDVSGTFGVSKLDELPFCAALSLLQAVKRSGEDTRANARVSAAIDFSFIK